MDDKSILKSKKFSVFTTLISIINENEVDDSNYILAMYILNNFSNLNNLNIYDTAEDCYVSRSSVRRFCKHIGLESFSELKKCFDEWEHLKNKYDQIVLNYSKNDYLINSIKTNIKTINNIFNGDKLDYLAELIYNGREVLLVASEFSGSCLFEFQHAMMIIGKPIRLMTSSYLNEHVFDSLTKEDVVITISITGVYAYSIIDLLNNKPCYKLLLTTNKDDNFDVVFDEVMDLGINLSVVESRDFSKYGIGYLLDKLLARYAQLYK